MKTFIENMDFLYNKKIAVRKNSTVHDMLKVEFPKLNFVFIKNIEEGLGKVSKKEIYAYIDIKPNLSYNIAKYEFNDLKISGNTGLSFPLRVMIRDDYKVLQSVLNKAITSLDEDEINKIVQKWENVHFEETFNYAKFWIIFTIIIVIFLF